MKVIDASYEIIERGMNYQEMLKFVDQIGRTCYKSTPGETVADMEDFVRRLIKRGHESVLEHVHFTIKFICDRGVSHELVRHRNTAYTQESTRYCNYNADKFDGQITYIRPSFYDTNSVEYHVWLNDMADAEKAYKNLLESGSSPEKARSVLPNSLKTEIVFTMNVRELRSFLKLRTDSAAHPQMRELTVKLLKELINDYPAFFDDMDYESMNFHQALRLMSEGKHMQLPEWGNVSIGCGGKDEFFLWRYSIQMGGYVPIVTEDGDSVELDHMLSAKNIASDNWRVFDPVVFLEKINKVNLETEPTYGFMDIIKLILSDHIVASRKAWVSGDVLICVSVGGEIIRKTANSAAVYNPTNEDINATDWIVRDDVDDSNNK